MYLLLRNRVILSNDWNSTGSQALFKVTLGLEVEMAEYLFGIILMLPLVCPKLLPVAMFYRSELRVHVGS